MNYYQTLEFLYSQLPAYHRIGKAAYKSDLNNSIAIDNYLGHPHSGYNTIHVAGTNGKGSVSHMIASVLMEAGFKTGLYTSPHLLDYRERIKVNGQMIPKKSVTQFVKRISSLIDKIKPSFFEMSVAMAFEYFAETEVDFAVIEAGLGGRLDSTNIICPVLSVITNIGHDHMDLLGTSLKEIAGEKAGIIKPSIPIIIGESMEGIDDIFIQRARETDSEIFFADQSYLCQIDNLEIAVGKAGYNVLEKASGITFSGMTDLTGDYQAKNIQTVFVAIKILRATLNISNDAIVEGIGNVKKSTGLNGRWQILRKNPLVICDTGHNKEGLEYIIRQINRIPKNNLHIIIGFVNDKDRNSLFPIFPESATYYYTKASVPRALDENVLMSEAIRWNLKGRSYPDVKSAIKSALAGASDKDLVFIGGSTFVVADALKYL
jgi:dihydrofolate synthase/folylpolyglutamate synthase